MSLRALVDRSLVRGVQADGTLQGVQQLLHPVVATLMKNWKWSRRPGPRQLLHLQIDNLCCVFFLLENNRMIQNLLMLEQ